MLHDLRQTPREIRAALRRVLGEDHQTQALGAGWAWATAEISSTDPDCRIKTNHHNPMSFKSVAKSVSKKEHMPFANAAAIIASSSRNASPAAKKANPKLLKVKGSQ